jgi:arsenate reductase
MSARILFVCTVNIARSQIAEGLARALAAPGVDVAIAGSRPNPKGIHPFAVEVLRERVIDISGQRSKKVEDVSGEFDYVITLCDDANQSCPVLPARQARIHWSIPDPAAAGDDPQAQMTFFRDVRDEVERRLRRFLSERRLLGTSQ